jgi:hypothetical protein
MNKLFYSLLFLFVASTVLAAPSITSVNTLGVGATTATISWVLNQTASNNTLSYGLTTAYGSRAYGANVTATPSVSITGLTHSTKYYYQINSTNVTTVSTTGSFTTTRCTGSANSVLDCDTLDGMPASGSNLGDFLKNLAPGVGFFLLIVGIFIAIGLMLAGIVAGIKGYLK